MSRDPRSYDPFRPRPRKPKPAPKPEARAAAVSPPAATESRSVTPGAGTEVQLPADLDGMRKADLIDLCADHDLPTDGTKADLIDRLLAL